jgi:hypothetical protein
MINNRFNVVYHLLYGCKIKQNIDMKEFNLGEKVSTKGMGVFNIINKHDKFSGWVNSKEPLMLVYDGNIDQEKYITFSEYKDMGYDIIKNISIITKGYFDRKIYLTEDKPRYDIKNIETDEVIKGCYLHNGFWFGV